MLSDTYPDRLFLYKPEEANRLLNKKPTTPKRVERVFNLANRTLGFKFINLCIALDIGFEYIFIDHFHTFIVSERLERIRQLEQLWNGTEENQSTMKDRGLAVRPYFEKDCKQAIKDLEKVAKMHSPIPVIVKSAKWNRCLIHDEAAPMFTLDGRLILNDNNNG
jgi:hypothetical protein